MEYLSTLGPNYLLRSPMLIAWIIGIIIAAYMMRKGGGAPERLLLIGCCLMFAGQLLSPLHSILIPWLIGQGNVDMARLALINSLTSLPIGLINAAGIVCLVFAFWKRWRSQEATQ